MKRFCVLAAVVGLTCLLSGCSQILAVEGPGPVDLGVGANGTLLKVAPQTVVRITLDSNVTTGYSWKLAQLDTQVAEQTKQEYLAPESQMAGAGGREVWTFTTRAAGKTQLRLEYVRPWETNAAPAKTFQITLTVR